MRNQLLTLLVYLVLTGLIFSCKKSSAPPVNGGGPGNHGSGNTTTPGDSIVVKLDFETPLTLNYELIISEPGGKILLDTQTVSNTTINGTLYTAQPLLDLTTIRPLGDSNLVIYTYKGVSPGQWYDLQLSMYYSSPNEMNTTPATITYTNMPTESTANFLFADPLGIGYTGGSGNNSLTFQYDMAAGKYAYLLLPPLGLYNLHIPLSTHDTVDLTQMDTATMLNYNLPAGYTYSFTNLVGIQDTTDETKSLQISNGLLTYPPGTQLELPSMPFEKFSGEVDASLGSQETGIFTYYGDTIELTIPYFTPGSYTLNAIDMNNVDPVFSTTATRYMTSWSVNANTVLNIYSSPDSVQHPGALINAIASQSRMLKGVSVANLTLNSFSYYNTDNLTYSNYCQKASNYNSGTDQPIQKEIGYYKYY